MIELDFGRGSTLTGWPLRHLLPYGNCTNDTAPTICLSDKWRRIYRPLRSLTQNSQCVREVINPRICSLQSRTSPGVGIGCPPLIHAVPPQIPPHFPLCILLAHSRFARGTHLRVIGKRVCRTQRTARNPGCVNRCSVHGRSSEI